MLKIHSLPRIVFPLFTMALLLAGLFVSNGVVGGLLLIALGGVLGWLVALSWTLITPTAKLVRSLLVIFVLAYAIGRMTGRV